MGTSCAELEIVEFSTTCFHCRTASSPGVGISEFMRAQQPYVQKPLEAFQTVLSKGEIDTESN